TYGVASLGSMLSRPREPVEHLKHSPMATHPVSDRAHAAPTYTTPAYPTSKYTAPSSSSYAASSSGYGSGGYPSVSDRRYETGSGYGGTSSGGALSTPPAPGPSTRIRSPQFNVQPLSGRDRAGGVASAKSPREKVRYYTSYGEREREKEREGQGVRPRYHPESPYSLNMHTDTDRGDRGYTAERRERVPVASPQGTASPIRFSVVPSPPAAIPDTLSYSTSVSSLGGSGRHRERAAPSTTHTQQRQRMQLISSRDRDSAGGGQAEARDHPSTMSSMGDRGQVLLAPSLSFVRRDSPRDTRGVEREIERAVQSDMERARESQRARTERGIAMERAMAIVAEAEADRDRQRERVGGVSRTPTRPQPSSAYRASPVSSSQGTRIHSIHSPSSAVDAERHTVSDMQRGVESGMARANEISSMSAFSLSSSRQGERERAGTDRVSHPAVSGSPGLTRGASVMSLISIRDPTREREEQREKERESEREQKERMARLSVESERTRPMSVEDVLGGGKVPGSSSPVYAAPAEREREREMETQAQVETPQPQTKPEYKTEYDIEVEREARWEREREAERQAECEKQGGERQPHRVVAVPLSPHVEVRQEVTEATLEMERERERETEHRAALMSGLYPVSHQRSGLESVTRAISMSVSESESSEGEGVESETPPTHIGQRVHQAVDADAVPDSPSVTVEAMSSDSLPPFDMGERERVRDMGQVQGVSPSDVGVDMVDIEVESEADSDLEGGVAEVHQPLVSALPNPSLGTIAAHPHPHPLSVSEVRVGSEGEGESLSPSPSPGVGEREAQTMEAEPLVTTPPPQSQDILPPPPRCLRIVDCLSAPPIRGTLTVVSVQAQDMDM
ncbi:hypothetical protein KIPB_010613, partial [Kipferlia bialata]